MHYQRLNKGTTPRNKIEVPHRRKGEKKKKIATCVRINRWQKSLVIFAGDKIRRDRRIKSPSVSPALSRSYSVMYRITTWDKSTQKGIKNKQRKQQQQQNKIQRNLNFQSAGRPQCDHF